MAVSFSKKSEAEIVRIIGRYPNQRAALLPVLWVAQREFRWLSAEVLEAVAARLDLPIAHVSGVASFYTMYYKKPVGAHHVQVCMNISCALRGADDIAAALRERLGVGFGETTTDGRFTLDHVECLASCGTAPMMQIGEDYHENLSRERAIEIIDRLAAS